MEDSEESSTFIYSFITLASEGARPMHNCLCACPALSDASDTLRYLPQNAKRTHSKRLHMWYTYSALASFLLAGLPLVYCVFFVSSSEAKIINDPIVWMEYILCIVVLGRPSELRVSSSNPSLSRANSFRPSR